MTICNACRYCEGLCAVFPAMEMRRTFAAGDLDLSRQSLPPVRRLLSAIASIRRRMNSMSTCRRRWRKCAMTATQFMFGRARSPACFDRNGLS